jgi:hypothetical protein
MADINGDGMVNLSDDTILATMFNKVGDLNLPKGVDPQVRFPTLGLRRRIGGFCAMAPS